MPCPMSPVPMEKVFHLLQEHPTIVTFSEVRIACSTQLLSHPSEQLLALGVTVPGLKLARPQSHLVQKRNNDQILKRVIKFGRRLMNDSVF